MVKKKGGGKKGKKSGGGKSGKKSKESGGGAGGADDKVNEVTKEMFVIKIRDLEEKIMRYEEKCKELQDSSKEIGDNYERLSVEQQQFVKTVAGTVGDKEDEVADCKDRTLGLQQAKDAEKELYEGKLASLRGEFQQTKDELTSKNMQLASQLASLEEFKVQREELEQKYSQQEDLYNRRNSQHKQHLSNLEAKSLKDRDRLKKDMMHKVNIVASDFRKVSNKMMAETTKRTIRENVSINSQIQKMSDKSQELDVENSELRDLEIKRIQQIKQLQIREKDLARKNQSHKTIMSMLNEKSGGLEGRLGLFREREQIVGETRAQVEQLMDQQEHLSHDALRLEEENAEMQQELVALIMERDEERKKQKILEDILSESAYMLKDNLVKLTMNDNKSPFEESPLFYRLIDTLLLAENLEHAAEVLANQDSDHPDANFRRSSRPSTAGQADTTQTMYEAPTSAMSEQTYANKESHYQLGDMGIVPREGHHIPTFLERSRAKMGSAKSVQSRLNRRQSVLMNSKGVQTDNRKELLADQLLNHIEFYSQDELISQF